MKTHSWRTPLLVLVAGTLVSALCIGLRNTFGLFLSPMSEAHGWGREMFSSAVAIQNLVWGLSAPITGMLADRYGTGRMIAGGGIIYALGLFLMTTADSRAALMLSTGLLVGLGTSATGFGVVLGAVGRITNERNRALYLGIASAGGSVGQFVLVSASIGLISGVGWVDALLTITVLSLLIVPLAVVLTGRAERTVDENTASNPLAAFFEAGSQGRFWLLFWGFFVCGFHITSMATHLPSYLIDQGVPPDVAGLAFSLIGPFNILGSLFFGYMGGRYSKRKVLSALYLTRAVFITLFITLPMSTFSVLAFASGMGFLWLGTVPLTSALIGQMYGVRYMNTLFSGVFLGHQLGAALGVWGVGWAFDLTGSYTEFWVVAAALGVFAALIHWPIDERTPEERARVSGGKSITQKPARESI